MTRRRAAAAAGAARPMGRRCRRRPCGGWRRRRSACSTPASPRAPRWLETARARRARTAAARRTRLFRVRGGALHHPPHAGLRLASRAQPAARGLPGLRLHASRRSNRWPPARWRRSRPRRNVPSPRFRCRCRAGVPSQTQSASGASCCRRRVSRRRRHVLAGELGFQRRPRIQAARGRGPDRIHSSGPNPLVFGAGLPARSIPDSAPLVAR